MIISETKNGIITAINLKRYFGFLATEGTDKIFWHGSALMSDINDLRVGDEVEFKSIETEKGPEAIGIKVIPIQEDEGESLTQPSEERI